MNHAEILAVLTAEQNKAPNCFIYWTYEIAVKAITAIATYEEKVEWKQYARVAEAKNVCDLIGNTSNFWNTPVPTGVYWPWQTAKSADEQRSLMNSQDEANSDKRFMESFSRPSVDRFMK